MYKVILAFSFIVSSASSMAQVEPMEQVLAAQSGSFYEGALPTGFTSKDIFNQPNGTDTIPLVSDSLAQTIAQIETQEKKNWVNYVQSSPWEFVSCPKSNLEDENELAKACYLASKNTLDKIAANPVETLGMQILDVEAFHKIYKHGVLVGYVIELSNNVDASIIQDGSGLVIYLDANMNVLRVDDWQA